MKRRIIAALTALVMVVTMIPASAFAATVTVDSVTKDIYKVTNSIPTNADITVGYNQETLEKLDKVLADYETLSPGNKEQVTNINNLYAAMYAVKVYCERIDGYKDAVNGLKGNMAESNTALISKITDSAKKNEGNYYCW